MNRIITYLNKYYTISIFKRSIIILILFAFPWCVVFSQDKSIIPPSPQSWEFAKYIVHEVSLYNGIPEISVPLYEVKLKGITIPINLSYHASGIKLGQSDRPVGVGWVLNPGYRISRTINGYADELSQMPDDLLNTIRNLENQANLDHAYKVLKDKFLSQFVPNNPFNLGILDGEYDQFVFSTPTASGEFIISDRNNKTIHTLENSNLLFDYLVGQSICENHEGIRGFKINDQMGNIFTFGEYNQQSECIKETASAYYGGFVSTAWGLSEINTPTNEVVKFTYSFDETSSNSYHIRNFNISEADPLHCMTPMSISDPAEPGMSHWYRTFMLNEIITPNEKILFNYGEYNNGEPGFIRSLEIKDLNNEIIKTIEFYYFSNNHHVFLDYITIHYRNHIEGETYRFDYYDKNTSYQFTYDHYGYYLIGDPLKYYHQEFMDDPIWVNEIDGVSCSISWGRHIYEYLPGLTCSRDPSLDFAPSNFSLKRITYPTGGYTDYFYEPGKYSDITGTKPVRNAGMRIQTIQDYDIVNQRTLTKYYVYGNNEIGYGVCDFWIDNLESLFVTEKINMVMDNNNGYFSGLRLINYSTTMQGDMGQVFSRGFVKYPSVSEYSYSLHPGSGTKTVYQFDIGDLYDITSLPMARNPIPYEVYNSTPLYITRYRTWDKPQIKFKSIFLWDGNKYSKVKEEIFGYEESYNTFSGL
ncbi:MAG: hypothetical protein RBS48_12140, partial [Ignavibacteriaceae bacterium]|nr:hypothetical protein [Ignavibacteriaceae bacterium]